MKYAWMMPVACVVAIAAAVASARTVSRHRPVWMDAGPLGCGPFHRAVLEYDLEPIERRPEGYTYDDLLAVLRLHADCVIDGVL